MLWLFVRMREGMLNTKFLRGAMVLFFENGSEVTLC